MKKSLLLFIAIKSIFNYSFASGYPENFNSLDQLLKEAPPSYTSLSIPEPIADTSLKIYDFKTLYNSLGYPDISQLGDSEEGLIKFGATEDEIFDLMTYTSKEDSYYKEINNYLRFYPKSYEWYGISPKEAKKIVKSIDSIFKKVPELPGNLVLFRGIDLKFRNDRPYEINEEFIDKGYVSTSVSFKIAEYFAIGINDNDTSPSRKAIFVLYFDTTGEKGILIDRGEDEVVLRRNLKFKVMDKKDNTAKYDLYLLQICLNICSTSLTQKFQLENF